MEVLMGKSSINGQFSMAMLNNQRVDFTYFHLPHLPHFPDVFPGWHPAREFHDAKELHAKLRPAQCGAVSRHDARSWRCVQLPASIRWDQSQQPIDFIVSLYCD
jgi:hypothetical protein